MKFRKRPVVIEAVRWTGENLDELQAFAGEDEHLIIVQGVKGPMVWVETLEGQMGVNLGDWLIKGVQGELYPCKPDIFEATYEPANCAPAPDALVEAARKAVPKMHAAFQRLRNIDTDPDAEDYWWGPLKEAWESLHAVLAAPRPERTYSAEEVRELITAFKDAAGAVKWGARTAGPHRVSPDGIEMFLKTLWRIEPILRRYGERKDGEASDGR